VEKWNIVIHVEPEEKARIVYQVALAGKNLGEFVKELILDAVRYKEVTKGHELKPGSIIRIPNQK